MEKNIRYSEIKRNKGFSKQKGFSVVEVVIVIAIIAVLATVLIPTFNSIIKSANESKAKQEITNAMKEYTLIDSNVNLDDYVVVYYESYGDSDSTIKVFGYKDKELYVIESEYRLKENTLYVDSKNYIEVSTDYLSNFPEYIRLFKYKKDYDIEYVEYSVTLGSEQSDYITSENKELLEGMYLPGEKVLIRPEKIADGVTIFINGELAKALYITDEPYEYEFVMPSYNVEITFQTLYILENSEVSFSQIFDFTNNLDINNINEIYYIPNQTLYNELNNDFTRCFYYKNTTTDGINNINRIIERLKTTSYKSCNDVLDETGLPREKFIILADDNIYEFYYDEYIYYNGSCYKNESYEALFTDSASEGLTFITNYMQKTEYTQPIYKNGVKQESNIDLRSLVFERIYGLKKEIFLPIYDESSEMTFTGIYGSEGDYGSFIIVDNYTFKKGTSIYEVLSDFSFEEYKKTYTVRLNQEKYGAYIIFDENSEITYDDLFKYIIIDDEWYIKDVYFFSYSLDNRVDIFNSGNIILDSNKTIYYTYFDHHIKLSIIYPFIRDLQIERIKELYVVNDDSDESGMSTCKYIENNDNTKEFLESFINSLKDDWYVASNLSYDPGIYGPSVPEKYIINTDEETYEFVYILSPTYKEKVYMKETPLVQIPDDIYETYYTLVSNDMTTEECIIPIYKNNELSDQVVDIRTVVFKVAEDVSGDHSSNYAETTFSVNGTNCIMINEHVLKCGSTYYDVINKTYFTKFLDTVSLHIKDILESNTPTVKETIIMVKKDQPIAKEEITNQLTIYNSCEDEKYYIEILDYYEYKEYETFTKNTEIYVEADFAYQITFDDSASKYLSEDVMKEATELKRANGRKYLLQIESFPTRLLGIYINGVYSGWINESGSRIFEIELTEDVRISFKGGTNLIDLATPCYYKDMYPFVNEIEVNDIVEIIKVDEGYGKFNNASFIKIDNNDTKAYAENLLNTLREYDYINTSNESTSKSKYVIVTENKTYQIDKYDESHIEAFPENHVIKGYSFREEKLYMANEYGAYKRINPNSIVFKEIEEDKQIVYSTNVKMVSNKSVMPNAQEILIYDAKKMTYKYNTRVNLEILNSFTFEDHTTDLNKYYKIDFYSVMPLEPGDMLCTLIIKENEGIRDTELIELLSKYGVDSNTTFYSFDFDPTSERVNIFENNNYYYPDSDQSIIMSRG